MDGIDEEREEESEGTISLMKMKKKKYEMKIWDKRGEKKRMEKRR